MCPRSPPPPRQQRRLTTRREDEEAMYFLTNRKMPRRTFLRGVGTTIALPFLESMLPARGARAVESKVLPTRFVGAFVPHGAAPGYWVPESTQAGFKFPFIYEPLE